jgi:DNA primase
MDPVIEEIRRRADIVEVVGEYVALTQAGGERWKACCPFHTEKTPSFYVSRDKGFFKCFGCSVSGDLFKFVGLAENLPFGEVKRKLAERYGVPLREKSELSPEQAAEYAARDRLLRVTSTAASWFREQFAGNAGLAARDYARSRHLKRETLEAFGIGYAPDAWDACTTFLIRKFGFSAEEAVGAGLLIEKDDERGKRHYDRYRHRLDVPHLGRPRRGHRLWRTRIGRRRHRHARSEVHQLARRPALQKGAYAVRLAPCAP